MLFRIVTATLLVQGAAFAAPPQFVQPRLIELPTQTLSPITAEIEKQRHPEHIPGQPTLYALPEPSKSKPDFGAAAQAAAAPWPKDQPLTLRFPIHAPGATSVELWLSAFDLQPGAQLLFRDPAGTLIHGPYTDADEDAHGGLALPLIPGDRAVLELHLNAADAVATQLKVGELYRGFRVWWQRSSEKSGSCNVDVRCPEGAAWAEQIRSVARTTLQGGLCTGQLINNTARDARMLFLTANHCRVNTSNAAQLVSYWNFEAPTCRPVGSAASGQPGGGNLTQTLSGAELLAKASDGIGIENADFALVQWDDPAPSAFNVWYTGWDRRDNAPTSGVSIHHPAGDEKRISFENQALTSTQYASPIPEPAGTHWRVADWDLGTTEGGSSGGGLWNAEKRLVGVLSGGAAACGNELDDWYGKLAAGWDGVGNTATRRLRDWLDPAGGGSAQTLDGQGAGTPGQNPAVVLTANTSLANVLPGTVVRLSAQATGGAGGYSYAWDLDNDGLVERDASTSRSAIDVRFAQIGPQTVRVLVTDSAGRSTAQSLAANVAVPQVNLSAAQATQICGDGDGQVEPGERWRFPVSLTVAGGDRALEDAVIGYRPATAGTIDSEGNVVQGPAQCRYTAIDISASGTPVSFTASTGGIAALDDGGSASLPLQGNFSLYGTQLSQVVMSTNGYLAPAGDNGGDYDADCPLPRAPNRPTNANGLRLYAFHQDLVIASAQTQRFSSCPRPPESGINLGCTVFQWNGVGLFAGGAQPTGNFRIQAFLYAGTNQIAYQYSGANLPTQASPTIAIQASAARNALTYRCGSSAVSVATNQAVCFYANGTAPIDRSVQVETPAIAYGTLNPGATTTRNFDVRIADDAACGRSHEAVLDGLAFRGGFLAGSGGFTYTLAGDCNRIQNCPSSAANVSNPHVGLFYNPIRGGNGIDVHYFNDAAAPDTFMLWYTGGNSHRPTWYQFNGRMIQRQMLGPIATARWNGQGADLSAAGSGNLAQLDDQRLYFSYTVGGRRFAEVFEPFPLPGSGTAPVNYTGLYADPSQPGWGYTVYSRNDFQWFIGYVYDAQNLPIWAISEQRFDDPAAVPAGNFNVHCPGCTWADSQLNLAGTFQRSFQTANRGSFSPSYSFPAPQSGSWTRNGLLVCKLGTQCN